MFHIFHIQNMHFILSVLLHYMYTLVKISHSIKTSSVHLFPQHPACDLHRMKEVSSPRFDSRMLCYPHESVTMTTSCSHNMA